MRLQRGTIKFYLAKAFDRTLGYEIACWLTRNDNERMYQVLEKSYSWGAKYRNICTKTALRHPQYAGNTAPTRKFCNSVLGKFQFSSENKGQASL